MADKQTKNEDQGADEVQAKVDEAEDKGFIGVSPDPTPNENYTLKNSAPGNDLPTPETDPEMSRKAASLQHKFANTEEGLKR